MQNQDTLCKSWEDGFCKLNNLFIHYTRTGGNKPPIVLLHGLVANGMCWKNIAQALSDNFDVIMPDARGHGKSSAPDYGYNYENLANDVISFLTVMNLSNVILVGHSMGGLTATLVACQSFLIRAVILADPTFLSLERQWEVWESDVIEQHKKMLTMSLITLIANRQKTHPDRSNELNELFAKARLQTNINAFDILMPPNPEYQQIIKEIKCPCLLLYGDSGVIGIEQANNLCKINHLVTADKIKNAGHGIYLDQPLQFVNSIIKFVDKL